ncbi:MAG TPA: hypothetical protein VGP33_13935 [Chloroflexota bacterium]|nr:hypothetical protein [Chloroflexota bacterium]
MPQRSTVGDGESKVLDAWVEASILRLNEEFRLPYLPDLVNRKLVGSEQIALDGEVAFYQGEYERLSRELELAYAASTLPKGPSARAAPNALLVRLRLAQDDNAGRLESDLDRLPGERYYAEAFGWPHPRDAYLLPGLALQGRWQRLQELVGERLVVQKV